jgi:hypothetical protein
MFKGFQNNRRSNGFNSFPALNFQMNNEAYGFTGCTFWLDAAYGLNTQTDLAAVSSWQPRIGYQFLQNTVANQPRLILSDAAYNNFSTVDFNGGSKRLTANYPISLGLTTAIIANYTTIQIVNNVIGSSTSNYSVFLGGSAANFNGCGISDGGNVFSGTTDNTNVKIFILTKSIILVNGVNEAGTPPTWATNFQFDQIAMRQTLTNQSLNGKVAEIIMFNYEMSLSQCQRLSDNINTKYAIY